MTAPRIDFYILSSAGTDAREGVLCRLVEKAHGAGLRAFVLASDTEQCDRLDEQLWTFRQGSFIPHARAEARDIEPIALGMKPTAAEATDQVLFNLTEQTPEGWQQWPRLVEIIDQREGVVREGRSRFRHYREAGVTPQTHELGDRSGERT